MRIHRDITDGARYRLGLGQAWYAPKGDGQIGDSLTDYRELFPDGARYYIDLDDDEHVTGGFIVTADDELVGLFSTVKGRGEQLVKAALNAGAEYLDCFDGYLTELYTRLGFVEWKREPNWTPGGPAVVYMRHAGLSGEISAKHDGVIARWIESRERKISSDAGQTAPDRETVGAPSPFEVVGYGVYHRESDQLTYSAEDVENRSWPEGARFALIDTDATR